MTSTPSDGKKVRFNPDVEESKLSGKWSFLRYLLTLNEELNLQIIADTLEDRGALSPVAKEEVLQGQTSQEKIEKCLELVRNSGPQSYNLFCEVLKDCGYDHVVQSLQADEGSDCEIADGADLFLTKELEFPWNADKQDDLAVVGVKMSLSALSKDTNASQRDIAIVMQRQAELERHLHEVMKSLDNAKDALVRERQEKEDLQEQLKTKNEDLNDMQRKYRELQKAMSKLKETNNKYYEKVTKLQIDNEELRKATRDKSSMQIELVQKNNEIEVLKQKIEEQEKQINDQQVIISDKLSMIETLAEDHHKLADGQIKLEGLVNRQSEQITNLQSEREEAQTQLVNQQKQLNFQHASIVMLQEHMEKLESQMKQQAEQSVIGIYPSDQRGRRGAPNPAAKSMPQFNRPFNTQGKNDNSKNMFWKHSDRGGRPK